MCGIRVASFAKVFSRRPRDRATTTGAVSRYHRALRNAVVVGGVEAPIQQPEDACRSLPEPQGAVIIALLDVPRDYRFLPYGESGGGTVYFSTSLKRRRMSAFCSSVRPLSSRTSR